MIDAHMLEAIGDAPDHIAALRKLAVAFAIGGHLDDSSIDATQLLASLEAVKDTLRKQGQIGKKKSAWTVLPEHLPDVFDDPTKFVPLGEIARIEKGKTGIKQALPGTYPLVVTAATRETCDHFDYEGAAAIIPLVSSTGHGNASINRLHYQDGQFALGTILAAVFPHAPDTTSARFLFEYLSAYKDELLVSRMTGTANVTLSIGRIAEVPVPLLSRNAQTKVDELMALCDRLEEARNTREAVRDKLTAASLTRLTAPDTTAEDFPTHAAFALEALPVLTTRPDQIKTLRQTILNLAVRGKLVEQDQADEPATELLEAIAVEQNELAKAGKIKRPKPLPPVDMALAPFDLPVGWSWARFPELGIFGRGKSKHRPRNDPLLYRDGEIPFIQTGEVARSGGRITSNTGFYNEVGLAQSMLWPRGTMCITIAANIADSGILDFAACFPDSVVGLVPASMFDNARYFEYFIRTAKANLLEFAPATAQKNINLGILETVLIPLPPLAEQQRIVAKVDALMALCDRLEAALTTTDTTRTRLLEALLHEALAPATDTLDAAE